MFFLTTRGWGGEWKKPATHSLFAKFLQPEQILQMSYKPQTNGALMEVLTLPKAEQCGRTATKAPQNDPCIPLPTPSLLPERGNNAALPTAALGGIKTWGAHERARPSFFCMLAGKTFGRQSWQAGSSQGNKKCKTERLRRRLRWLAAMQPRWTPLQTNNALGLSWSLGEKALIVIIQVLYLSQFGNPLPLIDSLMFLERWRCLHRIDGVVQFLNIISS